MAENEYRRYLNGEESSRPSFFSKVARGVTTVAGIAAGGTAAYIGLKHLGKTGVLSKGINKINRGASYMDSYLTGLNKTFDEEGVFKTLLGGAQDGLYKNMRESFKTHVIGNIREERTGSRVNGILTRFEGSFFKIGKSRKELADSVITGVRLDAILKDFRELEWVKKDPALQKSLEEVLIRDKNILKAGFERDFDNEVIKNSKTSPNIEGVIEKALKNALDIFDIGKKFNGNPAVDTGLTDLKNILVKYGNRKEFVYGTTDKTGKLIQRSPYRDVIEEQLKTLKAAHDEQILSYNTKETIGTRMIQSMVPGYKPLTVNKASELNLFDYTNVTTKVPKKKQSIDSHMLKPRDLKSLPGLGNAIVDPLVFINESNDIIDLRMARSIPSKIMKGLSDNFRVPLVNLKPFRFLTVFNREALESAPNYVFRRDNVKSVLGFLGKDLPEDDYYFMGGNVINRQGKKIASNIRLAPSKFGLFQREMSKMAGYSKIVDKEPETFIDAVKGFLDLGSQEYQSGVSRKFSGLTKFGDLDWERNIWYNIKSGKMGVTPEQEKSFLNRAYGKYTNTVDNATTGLSRETLDAFSSHIDPEIYNILKSNPKKEGTMNAIFKMMQTDTLRENTRNEFTGILKKYINDPDSYERIIRTARKGYQIDLPDVLDSMRVNTTELISSIDQAEKLLHMELLHQAQSPAQGITIGTLAKDMASKGQLSKKQTSEVLDLYVLNDLRNLGKNGKLIEGNNDDAFQQFLGLVKDPQGESQQIINDHLKEMIFKANPNLGVGPGEQIESYFKGNDYIPTRQGQVLSRTEKLIDDINASVKANGVNIDSIKDAGSKLKEWGLETLGEFGFGTKKYRAGRDNLDKVTTNTLGTYHYFYRLSEGISKIGLGLSTKNMGSTQDIAKNLFLKRIMAPLGIFMGASYLNYELGNITGEKPNQTFSRAYADTSLGVQSLKDITGLNKISRGINKSLPGFNLLYENPVGMALRAGSFGLFGEDRGYSNMKDYYEKGYDPIRKGRFWMFGSNTPFYGDRTEYFAPSWYRQTMGEPRNTSSLYGSEGEYWANTWFPNPRNLFGIKPLLDPYHWENKHKEDRPYPISGGTAFRDIPLIGPLIDIPISAVFKPSRRNPGLSKAHEEYLSDINDRYKSFTNEANRGAMVQLYPGGRITPVSYTSEGTIDEAGNQSGIAVVGGGSSGSGGGYGGGYGSSDPTVGAGPGRGRAMGFGQISTINQSYVAYANVKPIDGRSIQLLRDHTYVDNLSEAADPNSLAYRLGESVYSSTEIGGMYGFLFNTFSGAEDKLAPRTQLQASSRMYGMERSFWDQKLGGMGSDISEIYRRFLPHKRNQIREYNPLKNTMPDWMPGLDYFTDFKHGDPYVKIPKGEGRLPGAGYESMNKLHSDPVFGRYGALDRFKILADVAPWSAQYKYYNSVIPKMREDGLISDADYVDVQNVREMVSQRKKKYNLYPYKYKYSGNIEKKSVTVERILDNKTFLSSEMPGMPIRLAGIDLPAKDSEEYASIAADLSRYLVVGKKVKIAVESDPLMRFKDDVIGTMSAVLYDKWGDPVQEKLANKYKSIKADYEDNSAVTVNALFSQNTITIGKVWESFSHMDTVFHTKFLKVRSPIEHYKRQMVYGKDWQSWSHPIRDWVNPTIESIIEFNPFMSGAIGAGLGSLFGGAGPKSKAIGAIIGGALAIPSSIRTFTEAGKRATGEQGYTWIPARRRLERDIEEYFDMLKYMKYKGLYQAARRQAISSEGLDPEEISKYSGTRGGTNSKEKKQLENIKRMLKVSYFRDPESQKVSLKAINNRLTEISGDKVLVNAGPMTMRALQYKAEYEATLYGADAYGDLQVLYKAMPKKDRAFFTEFMVAPPAEREEILRLVPKNQRRLYQAKWGLKQDAQITPEQYFLTHALPDASWEGWKPGVSLETAKLKFVQNKALDMGEFGFWADDVAYAKNAPSIPTMKQNPFAALDITRLKKVLQGAGISNADIQIVTDSTEDPNDQYGVNVNMTHDRTKDINEAINVNMASLISG